MKKGIALIMTLLAVGTVAGVAHAGSWIPGTPLMIEEDQAEDLLETKYDFAYCHGVSRFGKRGEYPFVYLVFDCLVRLDDSSCYDRRYKSVKGSKRGYYDLKLVRPGACYR